MTVSLREVTADNVRAVCELEVREDQRRLVAPAAFTVAEAAYYEGAFLRAIYLDETPVGVLWADFETGTPYIVRLMVDAPHQRTGIGRKAVELVAAGLVRDGFRSVEASFVPAEGGAEGFW